MRLLFATTAGTGHFHPLVPVARACVQAGHDVRVAAPQSFAEAVARTGLDHAPFADAAPEAMRQAFGDIDRLSFEEANARVVRDVFGRLDAQAALPGLIRLIDEWQPDIVVRETCEFGSLAAAERARVPHAQVAIGMAELARWAESLASEPLAELGALAGLDGSRLMAAQRAEPLFTTVPLSLDPPARADPQTSDEGRIHRFRDATAVAGTGRLPPPWGDPQLPLVYVTFGTVAARFAASAQLFRRALDALADLPIRVLLTTGEWGDPESLQPWPDNAHVERWWPQGDALAHAEGMVGHGGFGTTMGALAAGVPQVVVPLQAADQRLNAERVASARAGIDLEGGPDGIRFLGDAVRVLLQDEQYGHGARAVATEIAALPDAGAMVRVLADLAAERHTPS